jgi:hypothetical protein
VQVQRAEDPLAKLDSHHPALEAFITNSSFPTINDSSPKINFLDPTKIFRGLIKKLTNFPKNYLKMQKMLMNKIIANFFH